MALFLGVRFFDWYCPFSRLPLASYEDRAAFKIFVLDVGLLGAMSNLKAKSLRQFVADNQSKKAYRISMNDYQQEDWVTNVPLYAVNGIAFANIYEVPKKKNPQPAMG